MEEARDESRPEDWRETLTIPFSITECSGLQSIRVKNRESGTVWAGRSEIDIGKEALDLTSELPSSRLVIRIASCDIVLDSVYDIRLSTNDT